MNAQCVVAFGDPQQPRTRQHHRPGAHPGHPARLHREPRRRFVDEHWVAGGRVVAPAADHQQRVDLAVQRAQVFPASIRTPGRGERCSPERRDRDSYLCSPWFAVGHLYRPRQVQQRCVVITDPKATISPQISPHLHFPHDRGWRQRHNSADPDTFDQVAISRTERNTALGQVKLAVQIGLPCLAGVITNITVGWLLAVL